MKKRLTFGPMVLLATLALFASSAPADVATIDNYGYAWETGGLPPSQPSDVLTFTGVADYVDPFLGIDLGTVEVTFYAYGLVSMGEIGSGDPSMVGYSGGFLEIYEDPAMNADWGTFPPNAVCPSTFADGALLFRGSFSVFTLYFTGTGAGAFEGTLDGLAGSLLGGGCTGCAYSWGGAFTAQSGAQIPDGYDLQLDGVFEIDKAVAGPTRAWGAIKAMYGN
jgi:hypothetical protein